MISAMTKGQHFSRDHIVFATQANQARGMLCECQRQQYALMEESPEDFAQKEVLQVNQLQVNGL